MYFTIFTLLSHNGLKISEIHLLIFKQLSIFFSKSILLKMNVNNFVQTRKVSTLRSLFFIRIRLLNNNIKSRLIMFTLIKFIKDVYFILFD
jgi:hypothetical protein